MPVTTGGGGATDADGLHALMRWAIFVTGAQKFCFLLFFSVFFLSFPPHAAHSHGEHGEQRFHMCSLFLFIPFDFYSL